MNLRFGVIIPFWMMNLPPVAPLTSAEIESYRRDRNLSQAALGAILGVSAPTINRWEKDERDIPGPADKLLRMLIRNEAPFETSAMDQGAEVRRSIGLVEMSLDAFEECRRLAMASGFGSVTDWIASLVRDARAKASQSKEEAVTTPLKEAAQVFLTQGGSSRSGSGSAGSPKPDGGRRGTGGGKR